MLGVHPPQIRFGACLNTGLCRISFRQGGVENFAHVFTVAWGTPANLLVDPYTSMRERPPYRFQLKRTKTDQIIFIFLVLSLSLIFTVQIWPQNVLDPLQLSLVEVHGSQSQSSRFSSQRIRRKPCLMPAKPYLGPNQQSQQHPQLLLFKFLQRLSLSPYIASGLF